MKNLEPLSTSDQRWDFFASDVDATHQTTMRESAEDYVEDRLHLAAQTLRQLPDMRALEYFNIWPTLIRESAEILRLSPKPTRVRPSQREITDMEEVLFVWLKWLEPDERRLVWLRANRVRWKPICWRLGAGRTKAWEMYRRALGQIAAKMH